MFDLAKSITYRIDRDLLKDAEMEIFKLEFNEEPSVKMIELLTDDGEKQFKYFYYPKKEFNKWYFVAV